MEKIKERFRITNWCQQRIEELISSRPKKCVDATAGTGRDTVFLCSLLEEEGEVLAMDIQQEALCQTEKRLSEAGYLNRVRLICDGHENMEKYCDENSIDLIMFNLGYLPGGNHALSTKAETTLQALEKGLKLLKPGGILSLMIYSGGDTGFEEKERVLEWLKQVDAKQYVVLVEAFYNKPNNPPLPVFIIKF